MLTSTIASIASAARRGLRRGALAAVVLLASGLAPVLAANEGDWQRWQRMTDSKPAQVLRDVQAQDTRGWPEADRLRLALLHARALLELGRTDEMTQQLESIRAAVEQSGSVARQAEWQAYEGGVLQALNQTASAMLHWDRALSLARAAGMADLQSFILNQRIDVFLQQYDIHSAAAAIEADRLIADASDDELLKARNIYWAATLQSTIEDHRRAEALFREAARRFAALDNPTWESDSQRVLANELIESDRAREALEPARRATMLLESLDDAVYLALARSSLALALAAHGRRDEALAVSERARKAVAAFGGGTARVSVLLRHALVLQRCGDPAAAVVLLRREVQPILPPESTMPVIHRRFHYQLAEALSALGNAADARVSWQQVLRLDRSNFDRVRTGQLEAQRAVLEMQRLQSENESLQQRSEQAERALKAEAKTRWLTTAFVALLFGAALAALWWLRRVNRRIAAVAALDALTGLLNRRSALNIGRAAHEVACRQHQPLAVLLVDVDHFKRVNDTHGHAAGDDVLRQLAVLLRQGVRRSDHLARWGGEEFLVLLPGAPENEAKALAERLRLVVGEAVMQVKDGAQTLRLTISVGLATVSDDDTDLEAAIERADRALYRAKHEGRDRVVVDGSPPAPPPPSGGVRVFEAPPQVGERDAAQAGQVVDASR